MKSAALLAAAVWLLAASAEPQAVDAVIEVPSGQPVTLQDVIWGEIGPQGLTVRFRFVAPEIAADGGSVSFEEAIGDMDHICNSYALPRAVTTTGPRPSQIIVSMAETAVEFGVMTDATQFIEAYSIEGDTCVWEFF